jgi:uncharacterized protein (TIGR03546 family)
MKIWGKIFLSLKRIFHDIYMRVVKIDGTPRQVAAGFALGAFIGIFPTFGLGGIIAAALSFILRLNVAATLIGSAIIMNPFTTPMFWSLSYMLGNLFYPTKSQVAVNEIKNGMLFKGVVDVSTVYLAGNVVVGLVVSVISYFVVKRAIDTYRKTRGKKEWP